MSHSRSFVRPCAEFPNDNPLLHDGVSWVCLKVGAPLRPIARARVETPLAPSPVVSDAVIAVAAEPVVAVVAAVGETDHEVASEVVTAALADAALPEVDAAAFVAMGVEATAPPPSVFALSTEIAGAEPPDVACVEEHPADLEAGPLPEPELADPRFEELALDLTPARSEVRAAAPDELQLDELSDVDDGFSFSGDAAADVEFEEPSASHALPPLAKCVAAPEPPPPASDSSLTLSTFQAFVDAVAGVALASGATSSAAAIPRLLAGESVASESLSDALRKAPSSTATVLEHAGGCVRLSASYVRTGAAWAAVLRGDAGDLSACGTSTLDGWAGDVLRALGVGADGGVDVKRELRRRGVAAFGMLLAA